MFPALGLPLLDAPVVVVPLGLVPDDVAPLVVTPGFFAGVVVFAGVVAGVRFFGVVVDLLDAGLLVGREVMPPIIPPPVTPPSCCPTATLAQASKRKVINRNLNRGGRGVVGMNSLPVIGTGGVWAKAGSETAEGL